MWQVQNDCLFPVNAFQDVNSLVKSSYTANIYPLSVCSGVWIKNIEENGMILMPDYSAYWTEGW